MSKKRNQYSAKFKLKVVLSALKEDVSISELSSTYGVHSTVIHRFKKEALGSIEVGFSSKLEQQKTDHADEVKELHAKIGELTMERDFLSKASEGLILRGAKK